MMKTNLFAVIGTALTLTACAGAGQSTTTAPHAHTSATVQAQSSAPQLPDAKYHCRNGITVTAKYNAGEDKINLHADTMNQTVTLNQVRSGSGERYESQNGFYGKYTEFHSKANEAHLIFSDPYGNKTQTDCYTTPFK